MLSNEVCGWHVVLNDTGAALTSCDPGVHRCGDTRPEALPMRAAASHVSMQPSKALGCWTGLILGCNLFESGTSAPEETRRKIESQDTEDVKIIGPMIEPSHQPPVTEAASVATKKH